MQIKTYFDDFKDMFNKIIMHSDLMYIGNGSSNDTPVKRCARSQFCERLHIRIYEYTQWTYTIDTAQLTRSIDGS